MKPIDDLNDWIAITALAEAGTKSPHDTSARLCRMIFEIAERHIKVQCPPMRVKVTDRGVPWLDGDA